MKYMDKIAVTKIYDMLDTKIDKLYYKIIFVTVNHYIIYVTTLKLHDVIININLVFYRWYFMRFIIIHCNNSR